MEAFVGIIGGKEYEREFQTENYVEIPPAYMITDNTGAMWSFGSKFSQHGDHFEFNVVRNDVDTDEYAEKIVYRNRRVSIYGHDGWRRWTGKGFI